VSAGTLGDDLGAFLHIEDELGFFKHAFGILHSKTHLHRVKEFLGVGGVDLREFGSKDGHVEFHHHFKAYIADGFGDGDLDDRALHVFGGAPGLRDLVENVRVLAELEGGAPHGGFVIGHKRGHCTESTPSILVVGVRGMSASEFEKAGEVGDMFDADTVVRVCENSCIRVSNVKSDLDPGRFSLGEGVVGKLGGTKHGGWEVFRIDDLFACIGTPLSVNVFVVVSSETVHIDVDVSCFCFTLPYL